MGMDELRWKAEALNVIDNNKQSEIDSAIQFLNVAGANTQSIIVDFENNSFTLNGTVESGEELLKLNEVIANSGSHRPINNNVALEDFSAKNILLTVSTRGSNLNVRAGAGTDNEIVGKFANGSQVNLVNKTQSDWYKVRNNEVEGFCHTNFLK